MLGGQPNHDWQLCFPIKLRAEGSDLRLYLFFYLLYLWWFRLKYLPVDEKVWTCCLWSGQPGFNCWISQLYVLLNPYLCFISFLYLNLYVLWDDASWISKGSFMQTKHIYVSWSTSELRVRLVPPNMFKPSSDFTDSSFVDLFCYLCFTFVFIILSCLFLAAMWLPAGKGLTSWLSCVWCFLVFLSDVIVSITDLFLLLYFTSLYQ